MIVFLLEFVFIAMCPTWNDVMPDRAAKLITTGKTIPEQLFDSN